MSVSRMNLNLSEQFSLDLEQFSSDGMRILVTGISGSGKSNAAKVIVEELVKNNIPVIVIDTESEYASLKEITDRILVLGGSYRDIDVEDVAFEDLIEVFFASGINIVLDIGERRKTEKLGITKDFTELLYDKALYYKKPFFLVFEECNLFAPEIAESKGIPTLSICKDISERGRKRGIHSIWITQRTARLSKDVIGNCNIRLIGRIVQENDIAKIKPILKDANIPESEIMELQQEFFLIAGNKATKFRFRKIAMTELGGTPLFSQPKLLETKASAELTGIIEDLVKRNKERGEKQEHETSEIKKLEGKLEAANKTQEELQSKIVQLESALLVAGHLTITTATDQQQQIPLPSQENDAEIDTLHKLINQKDEYIEEISAKLEETKDFSRILPRIKTLIQNLAESLDLQMTAPEPQSLPSPGESKIELLDNPAIQSIIITMQTKLSRNKALLLKILYYLAHNDKRATYNEIAKFFGLAQTSSISTVASALADEGLIKRTKIMDKKDLKHSWYEIELDIENIKAIIENDVERKQLDAFLAAKFKK